MTDTNEPTGTVKPEETTPKYRTTVTPQKNSEVEIEGEISAESVGRFRAAALKKILSEAELPGFRKGHAPENLVLQKYGEINLWQDAAEGALRETYPAIVAEHKLDVLGSPEVHITKLAPGNPLGFKITVAVLPVFTLPNYQSLAKKIFSAQEKTLVTDKELEESILAIRNISAGKRPQDNTQDNREELPELTDDLVKTFGEFSSVEDFHTKVKDSLLKDKMQRAQEKARWELLQAIAKDTTPPLPDMLPRVLVEHELDRMLARLTSDLSRANIKPQEYWTRVQKTEGAWRTEATPSARERVAAELVINAIAKKENLRADDAEVETELAHLREHHPDTDPEVARAYFTDIFTKEKVFKFLESKEPEKNT